MKYNFWSGNKIPDDNLSIFVFGSNPQGIHGKGAALSAVKEYGARYGVGRGLMGRSYALPTKNLQKGFVEPITGIKYNSTGNRSLTDDQIRSNIKELYNIARKTPYYKYYIIYRANSVNLNGYSSLELWKMFTEDQDVPSNIYFHNSYEKVLYDSNQ